MKLSQVVAKDVFRRKRRVLYTALGVAIGVAVVVAVVTVANAGKSKVYEELDKYGPNLMVMPAVSDVDLQLGDLRLGALAVGDSYISQDKLPEIRRIADGAIREALGIEDEGDIATVAPKLYIDTEVANTSVMVVGFEPGPERQIKTWWTLSEGGYPTGADEALLGARAHSAINVESGEKIAIGGHEITVVGVLAETGSNDDYQIFIPLETVQGIFSKEGLISTVDIRALCSACPVTDIASMINEAIPGVRAVAVSQVAETEMGVVAKVNRVMLTLAGITLVVGVFGVANTMMSSVNERVKDIGIMKAVGASRAQIIKMFVYEALGVGLVGGIAGYVAGTMLSYLIGPLIFDGLNVSYTPQYLLPALGLAMLVAVVASVYPSLRASQVRVAEALRSL
jgi:putative ABC transport system permease protein